MDIDRAITLLSENLGYLPSSKDIKSSITDIWHVREEISSAKKNFYFFGSRGSGKSTLIDVAATEIEQKNLDGNKLKKAMPCKLNCDLFSPKSEFITNKDIRNFITTFFSALVDSNEAFRERYKLRTPIERWIYSGASSLKGRLDNFRLVNVTSEWEEKSQTSRHRLNLSTEIAHIKFSLLDTKAFSFGKFELKPVTFNPTYEHEKTETIKRAQQHATSVPRQDDGLMVGIDRIINDFVNYFDPDPIEHIFVFVDDMHHLPKNLHIDVIRKLIDIANQLEKKCKKKIYFRFFSGNDLYGEVMEETGMSDWSVIERKDIESSLESLEQKHLAVEELLNRCLDKNFSKFFDRLTIDSSLLFSGGHPRRFLRICKGILEHQRKARDKSPHNLLMLAAAEAVNESRERLVVQLGIEKDENKDLYRDWYYKKIGELVDYCSDKTGFILIKTSEMRDRHKFEVAQWVRDAVAVGDLLRIATAKNIEDQEYSIFALNPATVYDLRNKDVSNSLTYESVSGIISGSTTIRRVEDNS